MRVKLEGIQFNYNSDLTKTGAFNIRRNETQIVRVPEWQPDLPSNYEASPAAYAICGLPTDMTIQASFECDSGLEAPVMVRAIAEFSDHILGDVESREIPNTGSSGFLTFKLPDARVACAGVGIHDIAWRWQFSDQAELWTDFQTTHHRIYTVLARPSDPWEPKSREPSNIHQPWTGVLDYACRWAAGAEGNPDHAAELITKNFFELGEWLVTYGSGESYAFLKFDCTKFLELLNTGIGGNQTVNCDDCATVVSTFANILGCQLSQSSLGLYFYTHPIVLIGAQEFANTSFFYHSVAWKGLGTENDAVFDGSLKIDEDVALPLVPLQPTNLPFGTENEGYRFSLVRSSPHVQPIPNHAEHGLRRRRLGSGYLAQIATSQSESFSELKKIYDFDSWPKADDNESLGSENNKGLADALAREPILPDWEFHSGEHFQDERFSNVFQILLKRRDLSKNELLAVNIYECKKTGEPNINLLEVLGRFEQLNLNRLTEPEVGNLAFVNQDGSVAVFRRERSLAVVRSAGRRQLSVIKIARILDNYLTSHVGESSETNVKRRSIMAHKLGGLKRIFRVDFTGGDPSFTYVGDLNVSKMEDNGNLPDGEHKRVGGTPLKITGRAYVHKGKTFFTFSHEGAPGTFVGELTHDAHGKLIVTGIFSALDDTPRLIAAPADQQEEPWVITKP